MSGATNVTRGRGCQNIKRERVCVCKERLRQTGLFGPWREVPRSPRIRGSMVLVVPMEEGIRYHTHVMLLQRRVVRSLCGRAWKSRAVQRVQEHTCSPTDEGTAEQTLWDQLLRLQIGRDAVPICTVIRGVKKSTRWLLLTGSSWGEGRKDKRQCRGMGRCSVGLGSSAPGEVRTGGRGRWPIQTHTGDLWTQKCEGLVCPGGMISMGAPWEAGAAMLGLSSSD